jgi:hypothetical protein
MTAVSMTTVRRLALASLAFTGAAVAPLAAQAASYVAQLEYRDTGGGPAFFSNEFGQVAIEELDPNTVRLTVTLSSPLSLFVNTGGPHDPFLFNTLNDNTVTILPPVDTFSDGGHGSFAAAAFGTLTDKIACCTGGNGQVNGETPPLVFTVFNASGISFAGNAAISVAGEVITAAGTDEHFASNDDGWWFVADIFDGATGVAYNVGARHVFEGPVGPQGTIPEPAAWTLMILGFGGVGALARGRRRFRAA